MTDLLDLKVLDGQGNLKEVQLGLGLVQLPLLKNLVEQLPALSQLQNDEKESGQSITSSRLIIHGWLTD